MPKPGTFYHPRDTWSSTVAEAEEHARFHAVDDDPEYDFDDTTTTCHVCDETDTDGEPCACIICDTCGEKTHDDDLVAGREAWNEGMYCSASCACEGGE